MNTRSADATIKGYYYQFDTTILRLLDLLNPNDFIVVEGIEDIDINTATDTTTLQCKYLSKPKFSNSVVREPIILMLDHFMNNLPTKNLNYILYAHFESETPGSEPLVDLKKLKEILTYREKKIEKHYEIENKISDVILREFIKNFTMSFGIEFYTQQNLVLSKLRKEFSCTEIEADIHFYNNALRIVFDKAIKKKQNERKISRRDFLQATDCRKQLFNEWYIKIRSKKEYSKSIIQELKSTKALDASKAKMFVIGKNILCANNIGLPISSFIKELVDKYYKVNSSLRNAKPLTFILDCDPETLNQIKIDLIENEVIFNDGYESIKFSGVIFNKDPIINTTSNGVKIAKTSYAVKLISLDTLINNISTISCPQTLINFSRDEIVNFSKGQFFDIKYCDSLNEVYTLLIL